jgi:hypothetical protein
MAHKRPIWLGVAAAAVGMAVAAPASQAADVKLSGTLGGAKLPKASAGVSLVRAMNLSDGTIAASQFLSRRGRFSFKVPPGPYGLLAGPVFFKKKSPQMKLVGALLAKSGKSRRLPLSLRKSATASQPIVGTNYFTGEPSILTHGVPNMLVTDLGALQDGKPCKFTQVELMRRSEVIKEIRLQQTKYFDPKSRVRTGQLLNPTLVVNGSLSQAGGEIAYTVQVVNAKTGKVKGTATGRTAGGDIFGVMSTMAQQVAKIICQPDDVYFRITGYTLSESSSTSHGERTASHTLSGGPGPVAAMYPCNDPNPANCYKVFQLEAPVTSTFTGHVTGTAAPIICPGGSWDYGTSTIQQTTRQTIQFDPEKSDPAKASAGTIPEVGDVIEDKCGAHDFGDSQGMAASIPADQVMSGNPVSFSFTGQGSVPSQGDHPGIPINWQFSETLTVQRVNADGSHI